MNAFLQFTVTGLVIGCIYALSASGLVVTYTTSGIFNFAQGAMGMIAAFAYWQLAVAWHWPTPVAVVVVLFVLAPLMGAVIERGLMRRIRGAPVGITLTVTLGLLLALLGVANAIWDPQLTRIVPSFFAGHSVSIFGVNVTYTQLIVVICAVLVAVFLRLYLFRTRSGTAMRAVVDDAELTAMAGASPARYGQLGWVLGAMLAALAGVLIATAGPGGVNSLDAQPLTFLVINSYAAAMVGRLRSLPLTFVGGIGLGLAVNYAQAYLPAGEVSSLIVQGLPMILLFAVLLVLPQSRLAAGRTTALRAPRVAGLRESVVAGLVLVAAAWLVSGHLSDSSALTAGHGMALSLIMLSLVVLTGYGGQVSLCQLTFAGIGAFTMAKVAPISVSAIGSLPIGRSLLGLLVAMLISGAVGAVVALPALRLRGLYLALSTFAFAEAMDVAFFSNTNVFGNGGAISVGRPHLPGLTLQSDQSFFVLVTAVFAIVGVGILALRRSPFGRRLSAMGDSPAASATLGMSITRTKLIVFTLSAALAGLGGALYGGQQHQVTANDFQALFSLVLILLATIWGIKTVSGMLLAGVTFAIFPVLQAHLPHAFQSIAYLATGLGAIGIARNPNGVVGSLTLVSKWRDKRTSRKAAKEADGVAAGVVEDRARIAG
jgi:branched-chain amino acid transport system permease protein